MKTPKFSRIEICHDTHAEVMQAVNSLRSLANQMTKLAANISDTDLLRLAVRDAIRETSTPLRSGAHK